MSHEIDTICIRDPGLTADGEAMDANGYAPSFFLVNRGQKR